MKSASTGRKKSLFLIAVVQGLLIIPFCLTRPVYGQWTQNGNDVYKTTTAGNVGIGTVTPAAKFHLTGGEGRFDGYRTFFVHPDAQIRFGNFSANGTWAFGITGAATDDLVVMDFKTGNIPLSFPSGTNNVSFWGTVGIGTGSPDPATKLHVVGALRVDGNIASKYQDVAEWVPARRPMPAGTVVVLDTEKSNHVLASTQPYDTRVAGVVTGSPGVILGEAGADKLMVATTGRVKVRVDATRAPIRVGDLLVTSDKEGAAMRSEPLDLAGTQIHRPGTLMGKALEPLAKGEGEILVLLTLQ